MAVILPFSAKKQLTGKTTLIDTYIENSGPLGYRAAPSTQALTQHLPFTSDPSLGSMIFGSPISFFYYYPGGYNGPPTNDVVPPRPMFNTILSGVSGKAGGQTDFSPIVWEPSNYIGKKNGLLQANVLVISAQEEALYNDGAFQSFLNVETTKAINEIFSDLADEFNLTVIQTIDIGQASVAGSFSGPVFPFFVPFPVSSIVDTGSVTKGFFGNPNKPMPSFTIDPQTFSIAKCLFIYLPVFPVYSVYTQGDGNGNPPVIPYVSGVQTFSSESFGIGIATTIVSSTLTRDLSYLDPIIPKNYRMVIPKTSGDEVVFGVDVVNKVQNMPNWDFMYSSLTPYSWIKNPQIERYDDFDFSAFILSEVEDFFSS